MLAIVVKIPSGEVLLHIFLLDSKLSPWQRKTSVAGEAAPCFRGPGYQHCEVCVPSQPPPPPFPAHAYSGVMKQHISLPDSEDVSLLRQREHEDCGRGHKTLLAHPSTLQTVTKELIQWRARVEPSFELSSHDFKQSCSPTCAGGPVFLFETFLTYHRQGF